MCDDGRRCPTIAFSENNDAKIVMRVATRRAQKWAS
jgi:hypothetical protein